MTQQINLYDPGLRRKREFISAASLALVSILLLLLVGFTGTWSRSSANKVEAEAATLEPQAKALADQLPVLGQQLASRKPDAKLEQELSLLKTRVDSRIDILALLQQGLGPDAISFAEYLRGFARQTPNGLWLTGFAVEGDGSGMSIKGRTIDPALVAEYIKRLDREKAFHGRAFSALQLSLPPAVVGSTVAPAVGTAASTVPVRPPYHDFTLIPASGYATTPVANGNDVRPSGLQTSISAVAPEAAHGLADATGKVTGGQR